MGILQSYPKFQALNDSGEPLSGGLLYTYAAGTSTPKATYSDKAETVENSNPIVLDSNGEAVIFLGDGDYKLVLNEPNEDPPDEPDDIRWTQDDIRSINFAQETVYKTTDYILATSDLDGTKTFCNKGATTEVNIILPPGNDSFSCCFMVAESSELRATASGNDSIIFFDDSTSQGGYVYSDTPGTVWELKWNGYDWAISRLIGELNTDLSALWSLTPQETVLAGYFDGFNYSQATDAAHDITVNSGTCSDSTGAVTISLTEQFTKRLDASFSSGTDAGGLASGTISADTQYNIFAIRKEDGTADICFDTSETCENLPSGFTYFRFVGSFWTDSSSEIIDFSFSNDTFLFTGNGIFLGSVTDSDAGIPASVSTTTADIDVSTILPLSKVRKLRSVQTTSVVYLHYINTQCKASGAVLTTLSPMYGTILTIGLSVHNTTGTSYHYIKEVEFIR